MAAELVKIITITKAREKNYLDRMSFFRLLWNILANIFSRLQKHVIEMLMKCVFRKQDEVPVFESKIKWLPKYWLSCDR